MPSVRTIRQAYLEAYRHAQRAGAERESKRAYDLQILLMDLHASDRAKERMAQKKVTKETKAAEGA